MPRKTLITILIWLLLPVVTAGQSAERVIVFGTSASNPPMEFIDFQRQIAGFSIDYLRAAGREAGFIPRFRKIPWEQLFQGLASHRFDAISASVSRNSDPTSMDFSIPYCTLYQAIVTPKSSSLTNLEELDDHQVGVVRNRAGHQLLRQWPHITLRTFLGINQALQALVSGDLDAVVCDHPRAVYLINNNYQATLRIAAVLTRASGRELVFPVNRGNHQVLELINRGIQAVKDKGIDQQLREKWFSVEPADRDEP